MANLPYTPAENESIETDVYLQKPGSDSSDLQISLFHNDTFHNPIKTSNNRQEAEPDREMQKLIVDNFLDEDMNPIILPTDILENDAMSTCLEIIFPKYQDNMQTKYTSDEHIHNNTCANTGTINLEIYKDKNPAEQITNDISNRMKTTDEHSEHSNIIAAPEIKIPRELQLKNHNENADIKKFCEIIEILKMNKISAIGDLVNISFSQFNKFIFENMTRMEMNLMVDNLKAYAKKSNKKIETIDKLIRIITNAFLHHTTIKEKIKEIVNIIKFYKNNFKISDIKIRLASIEIMKMSFEQYFHLMNQIVDSNLRIESKIEILAFFLGKFMDSMIHFKYEEVLKLIILFINTPNTEFIYYLIDTPFQINLDLKDKRKFIKSIISSSNNHDIAIDAYFKYTNKFMSNKMYIKEIVQLLDLFIYTNSVQIDKNVHHVKSIHKSFDLMFKYINLQEITSDQLNKILHFYAHHNCESIDDFLNSLAPLPSNFNSIISINESLKNKFNLRFIVRIIEYYLYRSNIYEAFDYIFKLKSIIFIDMMIDIAYDNNLLNRYVIEQLLKHEFFKKFVNTETGSLYNFDTYNSMILKLFRLNIGYCL